MHYIILYQLLGSFLSTVHVCTSIFVGGERWILVLKYVQIYVVPLPVVVGTLKHTYTHSWRVLAKPLSPSNFRYYAVDFEVNKTAVCILQTAQLPREQWGTNRLAIQGMVSACKYSVHFSIRNMRMNAWGDTCVRYKVVCVSYIHGNSAQATLLYT